MNEHKQDTLNMAMIMALADACGISAEKFAQSFRKMAMSIDYLEKFTNECVRLEAKDRADLIMKNNHESAKI